MIRGLNQDTYNSAYKLNPCRNKSLKSKKIKLSQTESMSPNNNVKYH